jgi:hypothetical protein
MINASHTDLTILISPGGGVDDRVTKIEKVTELTSLTR